jgi:CheY-like chemotaxis protein
MRRAIKTAGIENRVLVVEDGQTAIEYLGGQGVFSDRHMHPLPGIILLDLKLPRVSGLEVLEWIRKNPGTRSVVVIILTSSNQPSDMKKAYQLGANSFVVKPGGFEELQDFAKGFKAYWLSHNRVETRTVSSNGERA